MGLKLLCGFILFAFTVKAQDVDSIKKYNEPFERVAYTNFNKAKRIALQAIIESEKNLNDTLLLEAYTNLSKIYFHCKEVDSSLIYCNKALPYATKLQNAKKEGVLYNIKGRLAQIAIDFNASLDFQEKALYIAKSNNLIHLEVDVNNSLAILYRSKFDRKKSFKALKRAIDKASFHSYKRGLAESYNIKGLLFFNTQKDSVLYYYKKAIHIAKKDHNMFLEGVLLCNIGDFYLNIGNNKAAISSLQEAERISKAVGNKNTLYYITMSKGVYNENIRRYDKAVIQYKKALKNYRLILNNSQRRRVYWLLSGVLWENKQFEEAFNYQEKYIYLNDSIFNIEKEKEFEDLRIQYEVEKKDSQIILLEKENELAKARRKWIVISMILLAIPLIGLFLFYRHRAKTQKTIRLQESKLHQKEKEHLQQEQKLKETQALIEGQDKERERIAKELHDGIGGQLASVNLGLSHINSNLNNDSITQINTSLKSTFYELRALSHRLSYAYHKDKSFKSLLAELKEKYEQSKSFNLEISVYPENSLQNINAYKKHNLYRIIQELLANVVKHAKAELVQLSFNRHEDVLIIILEDNGCGFDANQENKGIGIKNVKERVTSINAKLTIDSVIHKGTSIIIEMPTHKNIINED